MFVGHFAVAFAARRVEPRLSLPVLLAGVAFLDILFPLFIVLGIEHARIVPGITAASPLDLYDIPISHSLLTSLGWSALFAAPWLARRQWRPALFAGACVFSHFVLDFVTHRPDLPLVPGGATRVGLGLWNALWPAVIVEGLLFAGALAYYVRGSRATGRMGTIGLALFVVVNIAAWLGGVFGPPPPSIMVVGVSALVFIPILLGWSYAIDRGRPLL